MGLNSFIKTKDNILLILAVWSTADVSCSLFHLNLQFETVFNLLLKKDFETAFCRYFLFLVE